MASALVSGLCGPGSNPRLRHLTLTVPLATQEYK